MLTCFPLSPVCACVIKTPSKLVAYASGRYLVRIMFHLSTLCNFSRALVTYQLPRYTLSQYYYLVTLFNVALKLSLSFTAWDRRTRRKESCALLRYCAASGGNLPTLPVLLYDSETWTIKASDARRITAAEMKYVRWTAGYTWTDYKTIAQIAKELRITPILDKLLEYKRRWIQHVNRMPRNTLPRVMKYYSPTGRRNHGKPLKRLLDTWDRNGSTSGPTPWKIYDDDVLGQPVGTILRVQGSRRTRNPEDGANRLSRNFGKKSPKLAA